MYNSGPNVSTLLSSVFIRGDLKLLGNSLEFLHSLMSIYSYYCDENMCQVKGPRNNSSKLCQASKQRWYHRLVIIPPNYMVGFASIL